MKNHKKYRSENTRFAAMLTMIILVGFGKSLSAQEMADVPKKINGGFGHFLCSAEQLNLGGLNTSLTSGGYSSINNLTCSFGGGGAFVINNFVLGGGGAWLASSHSSHNGNTTAFSGGYGFFSAGYVVYADKHTVLYPSAGFGGGGCTLVLGKKDAPADFAQQLHSPAGAITTEARGLMMNVQLNCLYFFNNPSKQGFFVGLKAGYKYSPATWNISLNGHPLENSPGLNMNGFFAGIVFGGGSLTH